MSDPFRSARSIDEIVRVEGGRVVATLLRLTGDLGRAEDAFAEAVVEALARWPVDGIPSRPGAWLTTVARRKALDVIRRERSRPDREAAAMAALDADEGDPLLLDRHTVRDDQLRLIFTCCHPALAAPARVALALRVLCGLSTAEIARAFLVPEDTVGRRISRAKTKIASAGIPYRIPPDPELPDRLAAVLAVVHVVFTTGHHAPLGAGLERVDLAEEGVRLARLLVELMPDEPECVGLLALVESTHARRATRVGDDGLPVLLADADRTRWDHDTIARSVALVEQALRAGRPGPYQLQAAISCLHGVATSTEDTDWAQIVQLYDALARMTPSVPVLVNRAVALGQLEPPDGGPGASLAALDEVEAEHPTATTWHLFHVARADALTRLGDADAAAEAFTRALACPHNDLDDALIRGRLADLPGSTPTG